ncbi:uncharacterized protein LOC125673371 isoform X3 [Ostrea edulis]|uniref:uncharacterized protein LOC125673371 isoform X3 n=1 Tax=Ostrea edulis TaxID=37623 RepID=UPI0024AEA5C9|nr:uncharacterized protein LOC125673371 isoform X3 [Ostrea edulis]
MPRRSKHPLLTGHTRREPHILIRIYFPRGHYELRFNLDHFKMKIFILMLVVIKLSDAVILEVLRGFLRDTREYNTSFDELTHSSLKNAKDSQVVPAEQNSHLERLDEPHILYARIEFTSSGLKPKQIVIMKNHKKIIKVYRKRKHFTSRYPKARKLCGKTNLTGVFKNTPLSAAVSLENNHNETSIECVLSYKLPEKDTIPLLIKTNNGNELPKACIKIIRDTFFGCDNFQKKLNEKSEINLQMKALSTGASTDHIMETNWKQYRDQDEILDSDEKDFIAFQREGQIFSLGRNRSNSDALVSESGEQEPSYDLEEDASHVAQFDSTEYKSEVNDLEMKYESELYYHEDGKYEIQQYYHENDNIISKSAKVWTMENEGIYTYEQIHESTDETHLKHVNKSAAHDRTKSQNDTGDEMKMKLDIPSDTQSCPLPTRREGSAFPLRRSQQTVSRNVHVIEAEEKTSDVSAINIYTTDNELDEKLKAFISVRSSDLQDISNKHVSHSRKTLACCSHSSVSPQETDTDVTLSGNASRILSTNVDGIDVLKKKANRTFLHHKIIQNEVTQIVRSFFSSKHFAIMQIRRRKRRRSRFRMLKYLLRFCRHTSHSSPITHRNPDTVSVEPRDGQNSMNYSNEIPDQLTSAENGRCQHVPNNPLVSGGLEVGAFASETGLDNEFIRLSTFSTFHNIFISAICLARNGWYYSGKNDMTICFSCRSVHFQWQEGDDPTSFHDKDCRMANRASAHLCTDRLPEDIITERPDLQTTGGTHNDCQRHADHTQITDQLPFTDHTCLNRHTPSFSSVPMVAAKDAGLDLCSDPTQRRKVICPQCLEIRDLARCSVCGRYDWCSDCAYLNNACWKCHKT